MRATLLCSRRRERSASGAEIVQLELDDAPNLWRCFLVRSEEQQSISYSALRDTSQCVQLHGTRARRGPIRCQSVDYLAERERIRHACLEAYDARRSLTLENTVDDHLSERTRCAQFVESRTRSRAEKLNVSLV